MKRQRRFTSEAQILKSIEQCRNRIKGKRWQLSQRGFTSLELENFHKSITRLEVRLKRLSDALAAFKTETFTFMGEDRAVVL